MLTVTRIDAANGGYDWLDNLFSPTIWLHLMYRVVPRGLLRRFVPTWYSIVSMFRKIRFIAYPYPVPKKLPDATTGIWCAYLDFTNEREALQAAENMPNNKYAVRMIRY